MNAKLPEGCQVRPVKMDDLPAASELFNTETRWLTGQDMGWMNTLGVRRAWRKHGLRQALLLQSFGEFYRRGKPRAGLGVDASSLTGATRLYERVGMRVTRQIDLYELELRPGRDLTMRELAGAAVT